MSHGTPEQHKALIAAVRQEARARGRAVAVLLDLQGPKIRVGTFEKGSVVLKEGADFVITTEKVVGNEHRVSTEYEGITRDVRPGQVILLADGLLRLEVLAVEGHEVRTRVVVGGQLKNHKGLSLPGAKISAPCITEEDRRDIATGLESDADIFALSFVRRASDVEELREVLRAAGRRSPIIAKIETAEAIENLEGILKAADGIMVARGDLGVEMGPERVPLLQKQAISAANAQGKLVITATEMLETMISAPRPTRAEASDVANAVLDGTDALMLSGETAIGAHPTLAVRTMAAIIEETERSDYCRKCRSPASLGLHMSADAIAKAAVVAAQEIKADAVVCYTETGMTARILSEYRPEQPIVALTTSEQQYRALALEWGVIPRKIEIAPSVSEMTERASREVMELGLGRPGGWIAVTMSLPAGYGHPTNVLKLHRL